MQESVRPKDFVLLWLVDVVSESIKFDTTQKSHKMSIRKYA